MAQYLVRRATIEPNLHTRYLAFIGSLVDWPLRGLVLQETYTKIKAILLITSPLDHSAAGSGLKSLGHWLGLQTLARNRCVCVCVRACVRASERACVRACMCVILSCL